VKAAGGGPLRGASSLVFIQLIVDQKNTKTFLKEQICTKLIKNFLNKKDNIFPLNFDEKKSLLFLFECCFQDDLCKNILKFFKYFFHFIIKKLKKIFF
jgi:hypothetical protein